MLRAFAVLLDTSACHGSIGLGVSWRLPCERECERDSGASASEGETENFASDCGASLVSMLTGVVTELMEQVQEAFKKFQESETNGVCFALLESPFNGVVMRCSPSDDKIKAVICDWIASGGPEALRAAKPNVVDSFEDHWITMPRSILSKHDINIPGVGVSKIVCMHLRVMEIIKRSNANRNDVEQMMA